MTIDDRGTRKHSGKQTVVGLISRRVLFNETLRLVLSTPKRVETEDCRAATSWVVDTPYSTKSSALVSPATEIPRTFADFAIKNGDVP